MLFGVHQAHLAASTFGYERHRPEQTVLYQTVAEHWPKFRELSEQAGGLPRFVTSEFEAYLRCGLLEHGGVLLECEGCGQRRVVAFSCKRRAVCPSCAGRRMNDLAAHLVDRVLLEVPIRQWVCSLPFGLRVLCGYDRKLCGRVIGAFVTTVAESYRRRAKRQLGLTSVLVAHPGAVTFVQRFDSALRLNVHAHTLSLDGVYVEGESGVRFASLEPLKSEDVAWVARRTYERVARLCEREGRSLEGPSDDADAVLSEEPVLASCYAASATSRDLFGARKGQGTLRLVSPPSGATSPPRELLAEVAGFNVHANVVVDGRDRKRLERLCRYLGRPPIAQDRLEKLPDGRLRYRLKKRWVDGTHSIVLEPMDLMARLVALVPAPRFHLVRYAGVLAPNSTLRQAVVPARVPHSPVPVQLSLFGKVTAVVPQTRRDLDQETPRGRHRWAWLLRRVFQLDLSVCERCGSKMRLCEVATTEEAIARIIAIDGQTHVKIARGPPPGQLALAFSR